MSSVLVLTMPFLGSPIPVRIHKMSEMEKPEELMARFEELSVLETEFEDAELEIRESPLLGCTG